MTVAPIRRILLADVNQMHVRCAELQWPERIAGSPYVIVGGEPGTRGVVTSASYPCRAFGVSAGMPMDRAIRLCPQAICVPVPGAMVRQKHEELTAAFGAIAPSVEIASVDEAFLDLTNTDAIYPDLAAIARTLRAQVLAATGLTISIGGGTNRQTAKMAASLAKPSAGGDGVHIVPPGGEAAFMEQFQLADIPFVGPKFAERLRMLGLVTVRHALTLDLVTMIQVLGEREGRWLFDRIRGVDPTPIGGVAPTKSISRDETFARDLMDDQALRQELGRLVARASADLREAGYRARTVSVRIRDHDFTNRQKSRTVRDPLESDRAILSLATPLLEALRTDRRVPARLLGVALSGLTVEPAQLSLFEAAAPAEARRVDPIGETERDRALARALDAVRAKFGRNVVTPGGRPVD